MKQQLIKTGKLMAEWAVGRLTAERDGIPAVLAPHRLRMAEAEEVCEQASQSSWGTDLPKAATQSPLSGLHPRI